MTTKVKPIPAGYHTITPKLAVRDADKAIDFYKRAFGAEEQMRVLGPDGKSIMHAELKIGDSIIMLNEEQPQMGCRGPQTLGGTPFFLSLYIEDVDKAFNRAVSAGATVLLPVADWFWGDRAGKVADPFGHEWFLATHKEDLSQEEIRKRATVFFAQMAKQTS
ncbi:MAG: VOC family protein [Nitrospirae bacterium]|nr:VOC family protein [Nitrospirota bacterium]